MTAFTKFGIAIAIALAYALGARFIFGVGDWNELFTVMSVTFLFLVPGVVGALVVYFSDREKTKSYAYQIFAPWVPVILFMLITLLFSIEGWACWMMILPVFLIVASIGGLVGGHVKNNRDDGRLHISLLIMLPFLLSPAEQLLGSLPGEYEARTSIDIDAPAEVIWDNVTRVREIPEVEDSGHLTDFLGFPRPVRAELDFEGVGAYREAIFTNGLVFHETVTAYEDNRKMVFDIRANPYEIPSTTLDEHVVVGGEFFDVLNGTYELEKLADGRFRLHLYSNFEMNTSFNFYAGWWGKLIMKDIQNNILRLQKKRSEAGS